MTQKVIIFLLAATMIAACHTTKLSQENWRPLFNGADLSGWETYLNRPDLRQAESAENARIGLSQIRKVACSLSKIGRPSGDTASKIRTPKDRPASGIPSTFTFPEILQCMWSTER